MTFDMGRLTFDISRRGSILILRGLFHAVDNEYFDGASGGFKLQSDLFHCGKHRRRRVGDELWFNRLAWASLPRPGNDLHISRRHARHFDIEKPRYARFVDYNTSCPYREH